MESEAAAAELPGEEAGPSAADEVEESMFEEPPPPTVADAILAGRDLRMQHKTGAKDQFQPIRPLPKPARPTGAPIGATKQPKRVSKAQARCLHKFRTGCSDRLAYMAKPHRRYVLNLWREYSHQLPPETIERLRDLLEGEDHFMPDQAYDYFVHMRKANKKTARMRQTKERKELQEVCQDRKFVWARNATVDFARGVQKQLLKPTSYQLSGGMLRLSDVILEELCCYMRMRAPARCDGAPKSRFMVDISDKIAVWIDQILMESDDRMLLMDMDEDEDINAAGGDDDDDFADEFLNMMGDGAGRGKFGPSQPPAYLKFTGEMAEVFEILTKEMSNQGDKQLISHGKFTQSYQEAVDVLKTTPDFNATDYEKKLSDSVNSELTKITASATPAPLKPFMIDMVDLCSKLLSQYAVYAKDKGPAFRLLVDNMKKQKSKELYTFGKVKRTYESAADELEKAKGLDADHEDGDLAGKIKTTLKNFIEPQTPNELAKDMEETLEKCSNYLAQCAVDEVEKGPAFDLLVKALEAKGDQPFMPEDKFLKTNQHAAHQLKSARGLKTTNPDSAVQPKIKESLEYVAKPATPPQMAADMSDMTTRCADYLSALSRDRALAFELLIAKMKEKGSSNLIKRGGYGLSYEDGATELVQTPCMIPFLPMKEITDELTDKLSAEMQPKTPDNLKAAMRGTIVDVSKYLSQLVAFKSKEGGPKFPLNLLTAVMKTQGATQLFKYRTYGQSYGDAAEQLEFAPSLQTENDNEDLTKTIDGVLNSKLNDWLVEHVVKDMQDTILQASKFLSKNAVEKAAALDHLLLHMKKAGDLPLATIQEYMQTHKECAERVAESESLAVDKVDRPTYQVVRNKLLALMEKNPSPEHGSLMPEIVEEVSEFLATPMPESDEDKKKLLVSLMRRKSKTIVAQQGLYKMTFQEGAQEIKETNLDNVTCKDQKLSDTIRGTINKNMPSKKLADSLADQSKKGAAHLGEVAARRGKYLTELHGKMVKKGNEKLVDFGQYKSTFKEGAELIQNAPNFIGEYPAPSAEETLQKNLGKLGGGDSATQEDKEGFKEMVDITSKYIASVANEKSGRDVDFKAFGELVKALEKEGEQVLGVKGTFKMSCSDGASKLNNTFNLAASNPDAGLKKTIGVKMNSIVEDPKAEPMKDAINKSSGFLARYIADRSIAFEFLVSEMEKMGAAELVTMVSDPMTYAEGGAALKNNPKMVATNVDEAEAAKLKPKLSALGAKVPEQQKNVMADIVGDASKYLAQREIDREAAKALELFNYKFPSLQDAARFLEKFCEHLRDIKDGKAFLLRYGIKFKTEEEAEAFLAPFLKRFGKRLEGKKGEAALKAKKAQEEAAARQAADAAASKSATGGTAAAATAAATAAEAAAAAAAAEAAAAAAVKKGGAGAAVAGGGRLGAGGAAAGGAAAGGGKFAGGRAGMDGSDLAAWEREKSDAQKLLETKLKAAGSETLYEQAPTRLTHAEAGDYLSRPPPESGSSGTNRLQTKFEKLLHAFMENQTPAELKGDMQDAIIESSRTLSEYFIRRHYSVLVRKMTIAEMQNRGDEILIDIDHATESYFFAAQRLKKADSLTTSDPCSRVSYFIQRKIEDKMKCRTPRKYIGTMKQYVAEASLYLSEHVTKPEPEIEAYVSLLREMEAAGDQTLISTPQFSKSYRDAAAYLKQLVTYTDEIGRANAAIKSQLDSQLKKLIADAGATTPAMNVVIDKTTPLLVSYVMLQEEKNKALRVLIEQLEEVDQLCLLRHGSIRRNHREGAQLLTGKNAYELPVPHADPVVSRKLEIKLKTLLEDRTPEPVAQQFGPFMDDLVKEAAQYLSVKFLEPEVVTICKCVKSVCVQCEIWRDESLRQKARPQCCSRHVSAHQMSQPAGSRPPPHTREPRSPSSRSASPATGSKPCPSRSKRCQQRDVTIQRLQLSAPFGKYPKSQNFKKTLRDLSPPSLLPKSTSTPCDVTPRTSPSSRVGTVHSSACTLCSLEPSTSSSSPQYYTSSPCLSMLSVSRSCPQPLSVPTAVVPPPSPQQSSSRLPSCTSSRVGTTEQDIWPEVSGKGSCFELAAPRDGPSKGLIQSLPLACACTSEIIARKLKCDEDGSPVVRGFDTPLRRPKVPVATTDQMLEWNGVMLSLLWNVQSWRRWIQEIVERASELPDPEVSQPSEWSEWSEFRTRVDREALQWRRYNLFSRQLAEKLGTRYKDKKIVSPTRATVKTCEYLACQREMVQIINMFDWWTHWLSDIVHEADCLHQSQRTESPYSLEKKWLYYKQNVQKHAEDWRKYNIHLKTRWEEKYQKFMSGFYPTWGHTSHVWVVSAGGAVPSGACGAGLHRGEMTWLARSTHQRVVLPGALIPTKNCCVLYFEGVSYLYDKYQVLCNVSAVWMPWCSGAMHARAVRAASGGGGGARVGRVRYRGSHLVGGVLPPAHRCHVAILGKPFAFDCYELLVHSGEPPNR